MYEFHPYFTNDGSVGLYSPKDDDIYHSTYGALSEAYEKFIEPAHIEEFLKNNTEIKVLDICFGIGYNTKSFLNTFLKISENKFLEKFLKKSIGLNTSIAAIDTDNILNIKRNKKTVKNCKRYKIKIDIIDTDETLLALSPLIAIKNPNCAYTVSNEIKKHSKIENILTNAHPTGSAQTSNLKKIREIKKTNFMKNLHFPLILHQPMFSLKQEVSIILYKKLLENNLSLLNSQNLNDILSKKENLPFIDKFMLNLIKFKQKELYKHNKRLKRNPFLHNIYYRYLSLSYKKAEKVLRKHQIDINPYINDARATIKTLNDKYNFIFLDAFTPSKCPCLWSIDFFKELYRLLDVNGIIVTYSNSVAIRSALIQAGFEVGKIKSKNSTKFTGTIATKNKNLIENPLTDYDLGLINSKAGICYQDIDLNLNNDAIIKNREQELLASDKISSSQFIKSFTKK